MARSELDYVQVEITRHGKTIRYFRYKRGKKYRLPDIANKAEYFKVYSELLSKIEQEPISDNKLGSFGNLIRDYYKSTRFQELHPNTQIVRRRFLDGILKDNGSFDISDIDREAVIAGRDSRRATPSAANNFLKYMSALFNWAMGENKAQSNPAFKVEKLKVSKEGHKPWTIADYKQYCDKWPIGTRQRLAVELLIWTGLRRSDVARLSTDNFIDDCFVLQLDKPPNPIVTIPVPSSLIAIIEATPRQGKTYIESKSGKQYTKESFGNDFHDWVIAAGLKQLSAHGLRKLAATLLAEAGATEQEIMAAMGWNTTDMANHYTKSANRKNLAKAAFNKRDSLTK